MENSIAIWVYFALGSFTAILLVISFLVGEFTDWIHDSMSPATDWLGDHLPFDHNASMEFSRILNVGLMLGFLAGFGFTAAIAMTRNVEALGAAGWGAVGGTVLGLILGFLYMGLKKSEATSTYEGKDLVNLTGEVSEHIPSGGQGRISCVVNGVPGW